MPPVTKRKRKQVTCGCGGYWFPHQHTSKYCLDYKEVKDDQYWQDHPGNNRIGGYHA